MNYPPNRRNFLIASGLTALASTRVLGANDTLRIGVIGAGGRMNDLLNAADRAGNYPYQIVAVSDVYGPRRDAVKERSKGLATTHADFRQVLDQQLDGAFIGSPHHRHGPIALATLRRGKVLSLALVLEFWRRRDDRPLHTLDRRRALGHEIGHAAPGAHARRQIRLRTVGLPGYRASRLSLSRIRCRI